MTPMPASKRIVVGEVLREGVRLRMKGAARALASAIREALPEGYRYVLVLEQDGSLAFASDGDRDEAAATLRRALRELEGS